MLPIDVLPFEVLGSQDSSLVEISHRDAEPAWHGHQMMVEVVQPTLMHVKTGMEWRRAVQLCHNQSMRQCAFRVLGGDVAVTPEPVEQTEIEVMQQAPKHGLGGVEAGVGGVVVAAGAAAVRMEYVSTSPPFSPF